ncbi:MAG: hypothetical protein ACLRS8_15330 [Parabacteroides merdae]
MNDLIHNAQIHALITFQATGLKLKLLNSLFAGRRRSGQPDDDSEVADWNQSSAISTRNHSGQKWSASVGNYDCIPIWLRSRSSSAATFFIRLIPINIKANTSYI